jgi:hypothetical protein
MITEQSADQLSTDYADYTDERKTNCSHEKAQEAQKRRLSPGHGTSKKSDASFSDSPRFSLCAFCAFLWLAILSA